MKIIKAIFLYVLLSQFCYVTYSQNLVMNHSFEELDLSKGFIRDSKHYYAPDLIRYFAPWSCVFGSSTPNFFSPLCEHANKQAPQNRFGYQETSWGTNYAGFACTNRSCEYLQGRLKSPLIENKIYEVGFYVSCADHVKRWGQYVESLGAYFSASKITRREIGLLAVEPHIAYKGGDLCDDQEWILIKGLYKATGGERYLILGMFSKTDVVFYDRKTKQPTGDPNPTAYYYIDNVYVKEQNAGAFENLVSGDSFVLNNLNFELGQSTLTKEALLELEAIIQYLKRNDHVHIQVLGYTDNIGTEAFNQKLSEERAEVVVNYLMDKGIHGSRLSSKGYGSEKPLADNQSDQEKRKNRRVEFKLVE